MMSLGFVFTLFFLHNVSVATSQQEVIYETDIYFDQGVLDHFGSESIVNTWIVNVIEHSQTLFDLLEPKVRVRFTNKGLTTTPASQWLEQLENWETKSMGLFTTAMDDVHGRAHCCACEYTSGKKIHC